MQPGWHRLLYLKAFTMGACSANKRQTCKSEINRVTVGENFEFATLVAQEFVTQQRERFKDALATQMALQSKGGGDPVLVTPIAAESRRKLFVSPDGVYDLDAMIEATANDGDLGVTDRYWGLSREEAALRFDLIRQKLKPAYILSVINGQGVDFIPSAYRTGKLALYSARCSDLVKKAFPEDENVKCCLNAPDGQSCQPEETYQSRPECNQGPLELADTNEETLGEEFLIRLQGMSPPPSPPPSPNPPPPPSPPAPPPPPNPPIAITADQGKAIALIAQRQFCDSVYMISAEARCSRLAEAMMTAFLLGDGFSPPPLPPRPEEQPQPPPPPPSPPRPRLPEAEEARVVYQDPEMVTLSTYFIGGPQTDPDTASASIRNEMPLENMANTTRETVLSDMVFTNVYQAHWAACSEALVQLGAELPCRTGDFPHRCINGARHCGTTEENTREPWIEISLHHGLPRDRDYYFFALYVMLPPEPEYARLFFQSAQGVSEDRGDVTNRFYEIEVFDTNHNPLPRQCKPYHKQSVDFYTEGMAYFQYVCLDALAEDEDYATMRKVRYVRLTLLGDYRMIWLTGLRAEWRTIEALPPSQPPPPPSPPLPPQPVAPPDLPPNPFVCHQYSGVSFGNAYEVAFKEPCGLSPEACCALAHDHNQTAAWHLSPSGCCTLLHVPEVEQAGLASQATIPEVDGHASTPAVKTSGARSTLPAAYLAGG